MTALDRFMPKSIEDPETRCWVWIAARNPKGYGRFHTGLWRPTGTPILVMAHRWSYEHFIGPIPKGLQIDHVCGNTSCVNPLHLEPVTDKENKRRRAAISAPYPL